MFINGYLVYVIVFLVLKTIIMETNLPKLAISISYYYPLLQKFALRLIENDEIAAFIAQETLEAQYEINGLIPSEFLTIFLQTDLVNRCKIYKMVFE